MGGGFLFTLIVATIFNPCGNFTGDIFSKNPGTNYRVGQSIITII